ncbi:hypothetical protein TWF696_004795 [Orbilia brochopaga]|uniref:Nephrocystin 3-like N-terminal domain-containing protein n=1 Tax=Orbilia brochopaga TaxID=3140254 RepID=A0AAV9UYT0_9PEZI
MGTAEVVATVSNITEYTDCLQSLYFNDISTRRHEIKEPSNANEWLWTNTTFNDWLKQAGVLWISGPPGSGKSVLAKMILNKFTTIVSQGELDLPQVVCGWFYSARLLRAGRSHSLMLRAILHQILSQDKRTFELAKATYRERFSSCRSEVSWDRASLKDLIVAIATSDATPQTLAIVDGIDESEDGSEDDESRTKMLEILSSLAFLKNSRVWLIALSRPLPEIHSEFAACHHIRIDDWNQEDVDRVIVSGIQELREAWPGFKQPTGGKARHQRRDSEGDTVAARRLKPDEEAELEAIQQCLSEKNSGAIMWVILVFAQIKIMLQQKKGFNLTELREMVEQLPVGIEDLYWRIITELGLEDDAEKLKMTRKILLWVIGSQGWGSLQLRDLLDGLAVPENLVHMQGSANPILSNRLQFRDNWNTFFAIMHYHCGPFIEATKPPNNDTVDQPVRLVDMVGEDWTVNLVHQTAKKFLEKSMLLQIEANKATDFVKLECLRYLDIVFPVRKTDYTPFISSSMVRGIRQSEPESFSGLEKLDEIPLPRDAIIRALEDLMNMDTEVRAGTSAKEKSNMLDLIMT